MHGLIELLAGLRRESLLEKIKILCHSFVTPSLCWRLERDVLDYLILSCPKSFGSVQMERLLQDSIKTVLLAWRNLEKSEGLGAPRGSSQPVSIYSILSILQMGDRVHVYSYSIFIALYFVQIHIIHTYPQKAEACIRYHMNSDGRKVNPRVVLIFFFFLFFFETCHWNIQVLRNSPVPRRERETPGWSAHWNSPPLLVPSKKISSAGNILYEVRIICSLRSTYTCTDKYNYIQLPPSPPQCMRAVDDLRRKISIWTRVNSPKCMRAFEWF